jgi:RHS repeat-associated protein
MHFYWIKFERDGGAMREKTLTMACRLLRRGLVHALAILALISTTHAYATVDVQPLSVTLGSSSVVAGGSLSVSWQIKNNGTTSAGTSNSQVRITTSNATSGWGDSTNNVGTAQATGTIGAGVTINQSTTVTVPTTPGTYYVWVIADNNAALTQTLYTNDTAVSTALTVTTPVATPTISFVSPSTLTQGTSYQNVTITGTNFTSSSYHQYSVSGGSTWAWATSAPTINSSTSMTIAVNDTIVQTAYFRVCASYGNTASCSGSVTVTIQPPATTAPTVQSLPATSVTTTSAQMNASVNPNGSSTTAYFEYGTTTSYGSTTGLGGSFGGTSAAPINFSMSGLSPNSTYHYRVVATNSGGTSRGSDVQFKTLPATLSPAQITVGPPTLNFGSVQVGTCSQASFAIQHVSGTAAASGTVTASAPFSITANSSFSVSNGQAANVVVQFCPTSAIAVSSSVAISSSASMNISSVGLGGTGTSPTSTTGVLQVNATLDGAPWTGSVNYTLSGPEILNGNTVPADFQNHLAGSYTLTYLSGGPSGATLVGMSPSNTQTLNGGGVASFTLNFISTSTSGWDVLSGHVRDSVGVGVGGVNVRADSFSENSHVTGSAVTAADGSYSIPLLLGTYTVSINTHCMPMPPDFSCPPPGPIYSENVQSVSVTGATVKDFTLPPIVTLSGKVSDTSGAGVAGASLSAGGGSATTGADGTYSLLLYAGTTNIQISSGGTSYTAASGVSILANTIRDFTINTAQAVLSGHVRDSGGAGVGQVSVTAMSFDRSGGTFTRPSETVTAADGSYSIPLLLGTYTVSMRAGECMPTPPDFNCPPPGPIYVENVQFVSVTGATVKDFTLPPIVTLSGKVSDTSGVGVAGVSLSAGGGYATTGDGGTYSLLLYAGTTNIRISFSGTIGGTRWGTNYTAATGVSIMANTARDFTLFAVSPSPNKILGNIRSNGAALAGVTVSAPGFTAVTDQQGNYVFTNLGGGTYILTPGLPGYSFSPVSRTVTLSGANSTNQDFRACQAGVPFTGVIRDATTGAILPNITVTVDNTYTGTADATGHYSISGLSCGTHAVSVNVSGFSSYSDTLDTFNSWTRDVSLTKNSTQQGTAVLSGMSKDPVNTATGNYVYQHRDMQLPGKGMPFMFERSYNSQAGSDAAATSGPFGFGWTHNYNTSLTVDISGNVTVNWGDGKTESYANNGAGGFTPQYGVFDILIGNADGTYTLKKKDLTSYNFDAANHLASIVDKNGNTITLTYTGSNLTQVTDTAGRNIDFTYDASNRIVSISDPILRTVQFAYDAGGNLATAQDANGNITHYAYDGSHQLTILTDPRGNAVVTNVYDAANRVVNSQRDAKNGQTTYTYDTINQKTTVVDQLGNATVDYHDTLLRLIRQDDANGNSARYTYDAKGNRDSVTDKSGNTSQYEYDAQGNVTKKIDPFLNVTAISYDANNNPLTRTDALNNTTSFTYDAVGNLTRTTDALGNTATVTYDASGLPLTVTDARGNVTTNTYDVQGNPIQVTNALGNVTTFTYDGAGRKVSKKDALNRVTTYVYDNNDNPLSATDPLGKTIVSTYDGNNNRLTSTDKRGNVTTFAYDVKDLPVSVIDALGGIVTTTYDALDRKIAVKDKRNNTTTFAYDGVGNSIQVTDALSNATQFTYDGNGNRLTATDPLGHTSSAVYDALNRQVSATDALTNTSTTIYDALSRVTSTTNAKGQVTSFTYDKLGRLMQVTDANSGTVKYAYDKSGNRISMTDPNGHVTTYAYDVLNRPIAKIEPLGGITAYQYDAVGNQVQVTQPNSTSIHYAYDALDRLSNVTYPDLSAVSLTYDANGNRIGMTDSLGASSYQYDALNRMTSATDSFGKTVSYDYDANGNRITLTYPGAKVVTYGYDVLNRLGTVSDWLTHTSTYAYDAAGRLSTSANPNGTAASYGYDNANRLTGLSNTKGATVIASYAYTLDAIGNHTQTIQNEPLPPVFTPGTVAYNYDADNRLNNAGSTANNFDANGNMTAKGANTFAYDFENRLKQSTMGGVNAQYGYNGTGNRLSKINGGTTTRYVLDTNSALSHVLAEADGGGTISAYYVYGLGLISRIQPNGTTNYYYYDSRGSTVALTDMSGAVTDKYAYDAFGKIVNSQGTTANPFKYLGQYGVMDESNGLHYVRARYYDADAGRFINKDPKAGNDQDGQSLHRYVYAQNNPVMMVDPSGLWSLGTFSVGVLQQVAAVGSIAEKAAAIMIDTYSGNGAGWALDVATMPDAFNDSTKQMTASWANLIGAFQGHATVYAEDFDGQGVFDKTIYKSQLVKESMEGLVVADKVVGIANLGKEIRTGEWTQTVNWAAHFDNPTAGDFIKGADASFKMPKAVKDIGGLYRLGSKMIREFLVPEISDANAYREKRVCKN